MGLRYAFTASFNVLIVALTLVAFSAGIPTSLVEEIKSSEIRNNKVKRAHPVNLNTETNDDHVPYFNKPSAIKRGANLELKSLPELQWEQDQADFINRNSLPNVSSSLYRYPDSSTFDDKTMNEYEKGYRYGTSKDSLDEALENAILKSELYGDPGSVNQYRYYGAEAAKKRRRRDAKKLRLQPRYKREVELSPEEILTLLSLYENNQRHNQPPASENYRYPWTRYEPNVIDPDDEEQDNENWLESPVYPHVSGYEKESGPKYYENEVNVPHLGLEGKERWRELGVDPRNKRFMVSKRRSIDPTRELRYLNGPNRNDYYTLSQLLSNQRNSDGVPYRRLVL